MNAGFVRPTLALYERAVTDMPGRPDLHLPLSHPGLPGALEQISAELGHDFSR